MIIQMCSTVLLLSNNSFFEKFNIHIMYSTAARVLTAKAGEVTGELSNLK